MGRMPTRMTWGPVVDATRVEGITLEPDEITAVLRSTESLRRLIEHHETAKELTKDAAELERRAARILVLRQAIENEQVRAMGNWRIEWSERA